MLLQGGWPIGVIKNTEQPDDGLVRTATVRAGEFLREEITESVFSWDEPSVLLELVQQLTLLS